MEASRWRCRLRKKIGGDEEAGDSKSPSERENAGGERLANAKDCGRCTSRQPTRCSRRSRRKGWKCWQKNAGDRKNETAEDGKVEGCKFERLDWISCDVRQTVWQPARRRRYLRMPTPPTAVASEAVVRLLDSCAPSLSRFTGDCGPASNNSKLRKLGPLNPGGSLDKLN